VTEVLYSVEGREPLELLNRLYQHNVSAPNTSLTEREMKRVHYSMPSFATCTNKQGRARLQHIETDPDPPLVVAQSWCKHGSLKVDLCG